ncbi:phosphoribosylaminoimidazole carboxylase ATPase subunit [Sporolactobacillus inulinus]|uniref:Phosphoribosylaminoimidazole carboxylase ATPase subunit n=1 Tax=Sporolactobacillus inulinus TaxID=2078 RepID=A0A4Y1Z9W1_9BACL|nr:phosphoribosylaminoimidazole carboxylase ATPase subunit [Sporolactobacillus inulinus]
MNQKTILPGQTIGILGGGQLGRMMAISAKQMGYRIAVLDPVEDCPCAQVADIAITANYDDPEAAKKMATVADVVTYEFENVDVQTVDYLQENSYLPQGGHLLEITKDRLNEKAAIQSAGLPVAPYMPVRNTKELEEAIDTIGFPSVLKTTQGGYDGKGQYVLKSKADLEEALPYIGKTPFELEKWLPFEKKSLLLLHAAPPAKPRFFRLLRIYIVIISCIIPLCRREYPITSAKKRRNMRSGLRKPFISSARLPSKCLSARTAGCTLMRRRLVRTTRGIFQLMLVRHRN